MKFRFADFVLLFAIVCVLNVNVLSQTEQNNQLEKTIVEKASEGTTIRKEQDEKQLSTVILINDEGLRELIKPKGKPLLVNFWATWCDVCREEFPDLVKIHQDYGAQIDVVVISLDYPVEINRYVPKFLAEVNAKMPAYLLKSEDETAAANIVSEKWQGGLPFTVLFDTDGKEIYSRQGRFNTAVLRGKIESVISAKSQPLSKSQ
jgi:thiol-disulfide isomerase/thioredoxin